MLKNYNYKPVVIGLGYVGLPLITQIAKKFKVTGFDISRKRINELRNSLDTTKEIKTNFLKKIKKKILFEYDQVSLSDKNFYIVTVPTPIYKNKVPDLSYLFKATTMLSKFIKKGDVIVYECTVYPGLTEKYCGRIISKNSGLKLNKDFYLGYSPERINPGDKKNTIDKITKVVSGSNLFALKRISNFYKKIIPAGVFEAKNIQIAEAAKVIENIQRDLNISLINEFSLIFNKIGINIYDVLEASKTKWNFLNFEPGLVGGHCIGVDPYYLTNLSKKIGYNPKLILAGRNINESMANVATKKFLLKLKEKNIDPKRANVLFLGLTFKENCSDLRNSKNLDLCLKISKKIKNLDSYDPHLKEKEVSKEIIKKYKILFKIKPKKYDAIVLAVPHNLILSSKLINIKKFLKQKGIFFDLKNKYKKFKSDLTL